MKILVADDSKTTRAIIISSLNQLGHEVISAENGQAAITAFQTEHPDLIILDVVMEGMDGFECARKIRELNSDNDWIPIIFLSASVDDNSIAKGINAGGDDYLTKPFSEITLSAKIKAMQRISEMRKRLYDTTKELLILSSTDPLTGIYNRFQFEKSLREKLSEADRHQYQIALLFIDLDHFKSINDSLGHHIGDLLLKEVAQRLKSCLRIEDFIARIGGDEFVVILSNIPEPSYACEVANKIIQNISPAYHLENNVLHISASIGIACYPQKGTNHQSFVQNADIAMYHAKELGRNNFQYYTEKLNKKYRKQINLERELKFALERNELYITYQPIYNLLTKQIVGVEALLRWKHPEYGLISPDIFIPIAEETGLIFQIGSWVLNEVCMQAAKWYSMGHQSLKLAVNVSLHQLLNANFMDTVTTILDESKCPTKMLELELTESTLITYTDTLKSAIKQINELGIGIAIDDFGTRYSSFSNLKNLPIDTLKIDKAFLKDIDHDVKNNIIVKTLIALGNNLNLDVIAEGIQTDEQLQFLLVNGCYYGQGYLLSESLKAKEMTAYLDEQSKKYTRHFHSI